MIIGFIKSQDKDAFTLHKILKVKNFAIRFADEGWYGFGIDTNHHPRTKFFIQIYKWSFIFRNEPKMFKIGDKVKILKNKQNNIYSSFFDKILTIIDDNNLTVVLLQTDQGEEFYIAWDQIGRVKNEKNCKI